MSQVADLPGQNFNNLIDLLLSGPAAQAETNGAQRYVTRYPHRQPHSRWFRFSRVTCRSGGSCNLRAARQQDTTVVPHKTDIERVGEPFGWVTVQLNRFHLLAQALIQSVAQRCLLPDRLIQG